MSEAKVKNFLLLAGGRKKKLVNRKGCNSGGPNGVAMSSLIYYNFPKLSRHIVPAAGLSQIRLLYPDLRHLIFEST